MTDSNNANDIRPWPFDYPESSPDWWCGWEPDMDYLAEGRGWVHVLSPSPERRHGAIYVIENESPNEVALQLAVTMGAYRKELYSSEFPPPEWDGF